MRNGGFVTAIAAPNTVRSFLRQDRKAWLTFFVLTFSSCAALGQTNGESSGVSNPPQYQSTSQSGASGVGVSLQSQSPYLGSVPSGKVSSEVIPLSFADAINRGLQNNLGLLLSGDNTLAARGQRWKELSNLLPNLTTTTLETVQETSLAALGLKSALTIPGVTVPNVVGPFNYFDTRISLHQSLLNLNYLQKERAAAQDLKAAQHSYKDARELVVLAVGNAYLQTLASIARVETAEAQVNTAQALYNKAVDQQHAGVSPAIDTLRAQVELQSRQQQLIVSRNDFAKQKLGLGRIIGLPSAQEFTLSEKAPYEPFTPLSLEQSVQRAMSLRSDYKAAQSQVLSAELSRRAATAEYFPTVDFSANYGAIGISPRTTDTTYQLTGAINIPIFQGGKVHGDVLQSEASLRQARSQRDNLRAQIEYEVRTSLLDLNAAADQVEVARSSVDLAQQTLTQAQDRFTAGVTDNLEVIQAQEALASANENYISSLYAHNLAKVEFARATGYAEEGVKLYLGGKK
jgi:outer membrane protein TolC